MQYQNCLLVQSQYTKVFFDIISSLPLVLRYSGSYLYPSIVFKEVSPTSNPKCITNGKKWQTGIFLGYTKNNGYKDQIATTSIMYTRGGNIDYVYRVAPRVMYNEGKMRFALELEHTTAAYGTTHTDGTVIDSEEVNNLRVLFAVYYFF